MSKFPLFHLLVFLFFATNLCAQAQSPCSHDAIMQRHLADDPDFQEERDRNEIAIQNFIAQNQDLKSLASEYTIPVVIHVFHWGDDAKLDEAQVLSGLQVLNDDFNGRNPGWDSVDPAFLDIRGSLDIEFCLASIDPEGNPTTGILYHEDQDALINEGNPFQYAWDNTKYFNIYLPKYAFGEPGVFTAYAYYPSLPRVLSNQDGIFYSSIRWGYGTKSELDPGHDWASVVSHEVGHWLDLRHTFEGACSPLNDLVSDTPPTLGGTINLDECNPNNYSCNAYVNGENYMDYNHSCKKMFTQGQVERMTAALSLEARVNLWSDQNLEITGCRISSSTKDIVHEDFSIFPNPVENNIRLTINNPGQSNQFRIYNQKGDCLKNITQQSDKFEINLADLQTGIYFISNGKTIIRFIKI